MFWQVTVKETKRKGWWGRILDTVLPLRAVSGTKTAYGTTYHTVEVIRKTNGNLDWEEITDTTGAGSKLLLPKGVEIPDEVPLKEVDITEYQFKLLENMLHAILKSNTIAASKKIIGIIDEKGTALNFAHGIMRKAAMLKVYTAETARYTKLAEEGIESDGTPLVTVNDLAGFHDCLLVVNVSAGLPTLFAGGMLPCPVLAHLPQNFDHRTKVIEKYYVAAHAEEEIGAGIAPTAYYAALYTENKVRELGSKLPAGAYCKKNCLTANEILGYFADKKEEMFY